MTLATRIINGNHSGPYLRQPRVVVMHSTRSGRVDFTDAQELAATLSWFANPNGASSHWVLSEIERVRVVADTLLAWHSAYLNGKAWGIELTQPTIDRPFTDGHYANAALVGRHYVALGVAPVWLDYWDGGDVSGFVAHQDTVQGRQSGKTDPGVQFDEARFIADVKAEMEPEEEDMTPAEVRAIVREMDFNREDDSGVYEPKMTLQHWLDFLDEHRKTPHEGGGLQRGDTVRLE